MFTLVDKKGDKGREVTDTHTSSTRVHGNYARTCVCGVLSARDTTHELTAVIDAGAGSQLAAAAGEHNTRLGSAAATRTLVNHRQLGPPEEQARDGQALALARGQTPQDSCSHGVQAAALGHQPLQLHKGKGIQGDRVCDRRERAGRDAQGSEVGGERV